jgi:hypothetical protein
MAHHWSLYCGIFRAFGEPKLDCPPARYPEQGVELSLLPLHTALGIPRHLPQPPWPLRTWDALGQAACHRCAEAACLIRCRKSPTSARPEPWRLGRALPVRSRACSTHSWPVWLPIIAPTRTSSRGLERPRPPDEARDAAYQLAAWILATPPWNSSETQQRLGQERAQVQSATHAAQARFFAAQNAAISQLAHGEHA